MGLVRAGALLPKRKKGRFRGPDPWGYSPGDMSAVMSSASKNRRSETEAGAQKSTLEFRTLSQLRLFVKRNESSAKRFVILILSG
jgi:hypothetical protein